MTSRHHAAGHALAERANAAEPASARAVRAKHLSIHRPALYCPGCYPLWTVAPFGACDCATPDAPTCACCGGEHKLGPCEEYATLIDVCAEWERGEPSCGVPRGWRIGGCTVRCADGTVVEIDDRDELDRLYDELVEWLEADRQPDWGAIVAAREEVRCVY